MDIWCPGRFLKVASLMAVKSELGSFVVWYLFIDNSRRKKSMGDESRMVMEFGPHIPASCHLERCGEHEQYLVLSFRHTHPTFRCHA